MTAAEIAAALGGRKSGSGWTAKCPAHDDTNPSLSLTDRDDKVLVKCFAGCDQRDVIQALRARGLWPENASNDRLKPSASYHYHDEAGRLLYTVHRYPTVPKKTFKCQRADGAWNMKGVRRVLFRLPQVLEAEICFVVEGEKDAQTLADWGFCGACNPHGAGEWKPEYSESLRGKEVIVIPDNDAPGIDHARTVVASLMGVAGRVRLLELPAGIKDVSEYFDRGGSEVGFLAMLEGADNV
ncbi:MAG: hypothetical protein IPM24_02210 [Bryobacterales bacterium]|nr:hypothetical protein [Bryobacterales bacterium]